MIRYIQRVQHHSSNNMKKMLLEIGDCRPENVNETLMKNGIKWPECDNNFRKFLKRERTNEWDIKCMNRTKNPNTHTSASASAHIVKNYEQYFILSAHSRNWTHPLSFSYGVCILMCVCFCLFVGWVFFCNTFFIQTATENRKLYCVGQWEMKLNIFFKKNQSNCWLVELLLHFQNSLYE